MNYSDTNNNDVPLNFFKEFLKRFFSESDGDKEAIDSVRGFFAVIDNVGMTGYDKKVQEAFDYILNTTFEEDVLMDIMNEYSSREAYEDRDAERFFTMIYENLFLGKDEIYDYYEPTEEELEEERRELEELERQEKEELERSLAWAENMSTGELLTELIDGDNTVRPQAVLALRYRDEEGVDIELIKRYKEEDDIGVKILILQSLVMMKSQAAFELFLAIVRDSSERSTLQNLAYSGLGELKDSRAIVPLLEIYDECDDNSITWTITKTLSKFRGDIIKLLMDDYLSGRRANELLIGIISIVESGDDIIILLLTYLESRDYHSMSTALAQLAILSNEDNTGKISRTILPYLQSSERRIRVLIVSTLSNYYCPETVRALNDLLNDPDEEIRKRAEVILGSKEFKADVPSA